MTELPDCPQCQQPADPRWYYRGVMMCDGCCPDPGERVPSLDRLLDLHGQVQRLLAQSKRRADDRDRYLEALRLIASCKVQVIGDVVDIAQKALLKKATGES